MLISPKCAPWLLQTVCHRRELRTVGTQFYRQDSGTYQGTGWEAVQPQANYEPANL